MSKTTYERKLISSVIDSIEKHGGKDCLSSIVLTGSFGRGEPTYTTRSDGKFELKSDIEIALVFSGSFKKKAVEELIRFVSADFIEDLNLMPISENRMRKGYNFNFSFLEPKYKTIFTYDLFNGSKTIWGRDFIGEKKIMLSDVDMYEAKRLVANRIGELIYLGNTAADASQKDYLRMQWKGKLMLAIASAWLICEGKYVSSYHGQFERIKEAEEKMEKTVGGGFYGEYSKVFSFLRENGEGYEVSDIELVQYVRNIDQYFQNNGIAIPRVNSFSRILKYLIKYMQTGMKYGVIGFENNILQALISDYGKKSERVNMDAGVWHRVLY